MQKTDEKKCSDCYTSKPDPEFKLANPICRPCYEKATKMMSEYKKRRDNFYPEIDMIEDNLYLGNEDAAMNKDLLKSKEITHVLAVGTYLEMRFPDDFVYENILVEDSPFQDIQQFFKRAFKFIKNAKVVFVHCAAGVSRSATIVIAYIMFSKKMSFEEAHNYVKEKRGVIYPNEGFKTQLQAFEIQLKEEKFTLDDDADA